MTPAHTWDCALSCALFCARFAPSKVGAKKGAFLTKNGNENSPSPPISPLRFVWRPHPHNDKYNDGGVFITIGGEGQKQEEKRGNNKEKNEERVRREVSKNWMGEMKKKKKEKKERNSEEQEQNGKFGLVSWEGWVR